MTTPTQQAAALVRAYRRAVAEGRIQAGDLEGLGAGSAVTDSLLAALLDIIEAQREALMLCDRDCEHLHHEGPDRHRIGAACPVEARVAAALALTHPEEEGPSARLAPGKEGE